MRIDCRNHRSVIKIDFASHAFPFLLLLSAALVFSLKASSVLCMGFPQKFRDLKSQRTPNLYNCLMYSKMQHSALRCVTYDVSVGLEVPLYMPPIMLSQVHVLYIFFLQVFSYSFGSAKCCSWGKCHVFQFINIFFHRWCSRFCI